MYFSSEFKIKVQFALQGGSTCVNNSGPSSHLDQLITVSVVKVFVQVMFRYECLAAEVADPSRSIFLGFVSFLDPVQIMGQV